jgi:hypothetical protein
MTGRRLTLVALLALALAACGSEEQTGAEKAFGGMSDRDLELADGVTAEVKRFSSSYADLATAMDGLDAEKARAALDSMEEHIDRAIDMAAGAENARWRSTYDEYLGTMKDVTTAGERIVEYLEATGPADLKLEDRLANRFQKAVSEVRKADRELIARVIEHAGPEERERLEQLEQDAQRRFELQAGQ